MTEQAAQYDHIGSQYDEYARTATLKRAECYTSFKPSGRHLILHLPQAFHPGRLLPNLTAGLVAGLLNIIVETSLAALIFSGRLSGYVGSGVGLALWGAVLMGTVVALRSSLPSAIAHPQLIPAAIFALMAAAIDGSMPATATPEETFVTVVGAMALTSLGTGACFWVLGRLKFGNIIRFVPYPVIGGFLAGGGWLLMQGAMGFMTGASVSIFQLHALVQADVLVMWLPGLGFAALLLVFLRRYDHFLVTPAMILAGIAVFYLLVLLTDCSLPEIRAQGWLLEPFSGGGLWQPFTPAALARIHWSVIFEHLGHAGTVLLLSVIAVPLIVSALEVVVRQPIDVNRELQAVGIGNLVAGLGGAPLGFHWLSGTTLVHKMGANSRLVGICSAALCGAALFFGTALVSYVPKPVFGGLLLFLGLTFLVEWVYDAWFKLPTTDYGLVLLILAVVGTFGILEGVGVGLLLAVVLFVLRYSSISVVRQSLSGVTYQSMVERPLPQRRVLCAQGEQLSILKLQGFLFFGTANHVLQQVRQRANASDLPLLRFVVLDFRLVSGLDASAVNSFARLKQLAEAHHITLVLTHLSAALRRQFAQGGYAAAEDKVFRTFPDLDHGVEWCENQLLLAAGVTPTEPKKTLQGHLKDVFPASVNVASVMKYFEKHEVGEGSRLIRQGDPPKGLYFLESGVLTAQLECEDGERLRLRTMGAGTVVGELGLYLGFPASASVATEQPSTIYHLSAEALGQMEEKDPELATALHKFMVRLIGERLVQNNQKLQALRD